MTEKNETPADLQAQLKMRKM